MNTQLRAGFGEALARRQRGRRAVDPAPAALFAPGDEKITYQKDLWNRFVLAALLVFLLDLLVRRVRIFDRKAVVVRRR